MGKVLENLKDTPGIRGLTYRLGVLSQRTGFAMRGASGYAGVRLRQNGSRPQIAAVLVGRNDDYMSDFRERLVAALEWNIQYLISEVIFVEWNPPEDRDLLSVDLTKRFPCLRAYVVPREIHEAICRNEHVPLMEYHAKNVGVRRAHAPWIMATNADAALGFDIINRILHEELSPEVAWTAERVDIRWRENEQKRLRVTNGLRY